MTVDSSLINRLKKSLKRVYLIEILSKIKPFLSLKDFEKVIPAFISAELQFKDELIKGLLLDCKCSERCS